MMKYVKEHINEKFSEESDPIKDMKIGLETALRKMKPKLAVKLLSKELKKYGLVADPIRTDDGPGRIAFIINDIFGHEFLDYECSFYNDEGVESDDEPGWFMENINMEKPTYDMQYFIKIILEHTYGEAQTMNTKIEFMKHAKKYLESYE